MLKPGLRDFRLLKSLERTVVRDPLQNQRGKNKNKWKTLTNPEVDAPWPKDCESRSTFHLLVHGVAFQVRGNDGHQYRCANHF